MKPWARVTVIGLAAAALGVAAPASAAPFDRSPYSGTEAFDVGCPGYTGMTSFSGVVTIMDTNPSLEGEFYRLTNRQRFADTITNARTGEAVTVSGRTLFKELRARSLGDGVFRYVGQAVTTVTFRDASGAVLLRERGVVAESFLFDTLNDGVPGGELLEEPELLKVSGPHATFDEDFDFCAFLNEATGP